MPVEKKLYNKIEKHFNDVFKAETYIGSQNQQYGGLGGIMAIIPAPLVKQQVIELAKFCENISLNMTLKTFDGKIIVEFW